MKKVVLDTNVMISAFWSPAGNASKIIDMVLRDELALYYDARILKEYKDVLNRGKFAFKRARIGDIINKVRDDGISVAAGSCNLPFDDEDDRMFYEVAKESGAILITGNIRHYPEAAFIMTMDEFLNG